MTLTKDNIKAMRAADSVVFRFETDAREQIVSAHLDLSKEVERGDGFGRDTLHVTVPTEARVTNYGQREYSEDKREWVLGRATRGDWVLLSIRVKPEWATFVSLLRTGDLLCQRWIIDNRSEILKEAGMTVHELAVEIVRTTPRGTKRLHFMLDASAHRANSLAEPIRRASVSVAA